MQSRKPGYNSAVLTPVAGDLTRMVDGRRRRTFPLTCRSRKARREDPLEFNASKPIATRHDQMDPEQETLLANSVGLALLVVLDTLDPAERLAFVLHDMFALPFDEIAPILGRSSTAARQLASRARHRIQRWTRFPTRSRPPTTSGQRLPRRLTGWRLRGAAYSARSRCDSPRQLHGRTCGHIERGESGAPGL